MNIKKTIRTLILIFPFCIIVSSVFAHPMPSSVVVLKIHEKHISGEIQLPLAELQSAIGMAVNDNSDRLIERLGDSLRVYLLKHIRPKSFEGKLWTVALGEMKVIETKSKLSGDYKELVVVFSMTPPLSYDLRNFYFDYDVILHQVASHQILVSVKQDWERGIIAEDGSPPDGSPLDSTMQQIGVIALDIPTNTIPVFQVSLQQGSTWQGFKSMVWLGMKHISEGTDHLLFLLTLLLPATLLVENKQTNLTGFKNLQGLTSWGAFGGTKYSLLRLLKIVTAFTVGHSLTLILGATKLVQLPSQPIEIFIAVSILISAIHAIRPIFAGKEMFIATGFGLIHGLAFANTLTNLDLGFREMALSIFGFNVGIELMQVLVIAVTIPFLIWLSSKTTTFYGVRLYTIFRTTGAILASIAAVFWIVERLVG